MKKWLRPKFVLKLIPWLLLCSCIGWAFWGSVMAESGFYGCFNTLTPSHTNVESSGYFKFPPSAQNIKFDVSTKQKAGCIIWVRFDMNSSDSAAFIKSTFIEDLSPTAQITDNFFINQPGWIQPKSLLSGRGDFHYIYPAIIKGSQFVFIDTSTPEKWVIYLTIVK